MHSFSHVLSDSCGEGRGGGFFLSFVWGVVCLVGWWVGFVWVFSLDFLFGVCLGGIFFFFFFEGWGVFYKRDGNRVFMVLILQFMMHSFSHVLSDSFGQGWGEGGVVGREREGGSFSLSFGALFVSLVGWLVGFAFVFLLIFCVGVCFGGILGEMEGGGGYFKSEMGTECSWYRLHLADPPLWLVVRRPPRDLNPAFPGWNRPVTFGALGAVLPDACPCKVITGTGWPGVWVRRQG